MRRRTELMFQVVTVSCIEAQISGGGVQRSSPDDLVPNPGYWT
jgi:hypothetical protein